MATQHMWQRFWDFITGDNYRPLRELPIAASLFYYCTTLLLARLLRQIIRKWLPLSVQPYILNLLAAFQMVACSLENVMIRNNYGFFAYCLTLFILSIWSASTLTSERTSPNSTFSDYMLGHMTLHKFAVTTALHIFGGFLSYRYARMFWSFELSGGHKRRLFKPCGSDLHVPVLIGLCVEFGGTFIDCIVGKIRLHKSQEINKCLNGIWGVLLTISGLHMTGMYLNPINASTQTFLCPGTSVPEHLLVYWAGPMFGTYCACWLQENVQNLHKAGVLQSPTKLLRFQWGQEDTSKKEN